MKTWQKVLKIVIKSLLIIFGCTGIILTLSQEGFMGNFTAFLYFTIQSNITIMLVSACFLVNDILVMCGKKGFVNHVWRIIKFVFTVAITVTFLVFFIILAPKMEISYLLSFDNFSVHFLVPVLALCDFYLFDNDIHLTKKNVLWGLSMPLYYLAFALIGSVAGFTYSDGANVPYFFLDYKTLGWFGFSHGLGVFYWIIILLGAITGLAYLLRFFMLLRQKKKTVPPVEETSEA